MAEVTEKFSGVIGTSSFQLLIYVSQLLKVSYLFSETMDYFPSSSELLA